MTADQKSACKAVEAGERPVEKPKACLGERHLFTFMCFLGLFLNYAVRFTLPIGIVAMVVKDHEENSTEVIDGQCPRQDPGGGEEMPDGEFDWDAETQGLILGCFYYGYALSHVPGGVISERYGGKWPFGLGAGVSAALTVFFPMIARVPGAGTGLFVTARVIQGLVEGAVYPAYFAMAARWLPRAEKPLLSTLVMFGTPGGSVFCLITSGYLGQTLGWEYIFYFTGLLGVVWFVFWTLFIHDEPAKTLRIKPDELEYIQKTADIKDGDGPRRSPPFPPLKSIFTSVPVIGLFTAQSLNNFVFGTLMALLPTYLNDVQGLPLSQNGLVTAAAYGSMGAMTVVTGLLSDRAAASRRLPTAAARKLFHSAGVYVPAAGLVWLAFVGCDATLVVVALCIVLGSNAFVYAGMYLSFGDLAPNYAGTLFGIGNAISCVGAIIGPYIVGIITQEESTLETWRIVFLGLASMFVASGVVFTIFVPAKAQDWNFSSGEERQRADFKPEAKRVSISSMM